jgi:hypothetical protein
MLLEVALLQVGAKVFMEIFAQKYSRGNTCMQVSGVDASLHAKPQAQHTIPSKEYMRIEQ